MLIRCFVLCVGALLCSLDGLWLSCVRALRSHCGDETGDDTGFRIAQINRHNGFGGFGNLFNPEIRAEPSDARVADEKVVWPVHFSLVAISKQIRYPNILAIEDGEPVHAMNDSPARARRQPPPVLDHSDKRQTISV